MKWEYRKQCNGTSSHFRAYLAEILLESLDFEEDFHVSDEWMNEIKERSREIDEGEVKLIPGEEGLTRLQEKYK